MLSPVKLRQELIKFDNTLIEIGLTSRELSTSRTKAQEAAMWAGKLIGIINGNSSPYKNDGKRRSIKDIEKRVDNVEETFPMSGEKVSKVDTLREVAKKLLEHVLEMEISYRGLHDDVERDMVVITLYQKISEIRFWLGMELGRMRDVAEKSQL